MTRARYFSKNIRRGFSELVQIKRAVSPPPPGNEFFVAIRNLDFSRSECYASYKQMEQIAASVNENDKLQIAVNAQNMTDFHTFEEIWLSSYRAK